jgi:hypothetical protein
MIRSVKSTVSAASISIASPLHSLWLDVDNIPVGADFLLDAKDEAGKRECPR